MKSVFLMIAVSLFSHGAFAQTTVSIAKIAELSAHRADRLVALAKIDGTFLTKLETIEVTEVSGPAPVAFKSVLTQTRPTSGTAFQLELQFDKDGKPLSFKPTAGGVAGPDPMWMPKNAGELIENGMHYVLDNSTDATVVPYFKSFSNLTLSKATVAGKDVALVQVVSAAQSQKLNIYLNLDGTLNSTPVVVP